MINLDKDLNDPMEDDIMINDLEEAIKSDDTEIIDTSIELESVEKIENNNSKNSDKNSNHKGGFARNNGRRDFRRNSGGGDFKRFNDPRSDFLTHLVSLRAVSKTRSGGRQRSFAALILAGNEKGLVGCGTGKAKDVADAIRKAEKRAKQNVIKVCMKDTSISHNVRGYFCGVKIIAKKVSAGTGLKAGGVARKLLTLAGVKDISLKCIGNSMSPHNVIYGLMEALQDTSTLKDIGNRLGKDVKEIAKRSL